MSKHSLFPVALIAGFGAGCGVIHRVASDPQPPVLLPEQFAQTATASMDGGSRTAARWWKSFAEPELDALVELALGGSLDLRAAYARLAAAEAANLVAWSGYVPQGNVSADVSSARSVFNFGMGPTPATISQVNLQGSLSYELDLGVGCTDRPGRVARRFRRADSMSRRCRSPSPPT